MRLLISTAFPTVSTGITQRAPLCRAEAMVDVARNTSMITTTASLRSYKCNKAGDKQVNKVGFDCSIRFGLLQHMLPFSGFSILFYGSISQFQQVAEIAG